MQDLDRFARTFHRFAELECPGMSTLYESLCHSVAEDRDLLDIAANARPGQPVPNLFMAAVHWLLLEAPIIRCRTSILTLTPGRLRMETHTRLSGYSA